MAKTAANGVPVSDTPGEAPMCARLEALLAHLTRQLPDPSQASAFGRAMVTPPPADVRVNHLLPAAGAVHQALQTWGEPAPWCRDAFRLPDELGERVGHSLEYRLGAIYVQAKATTLAVAALDPRPGELVLDLAAAPGGKATQIAAALGNTGVLVANEPRTRRLSSLVGNLERCGAHNTLITSAPGAMLARWFHNVFDRVLLDAPCSGDGIVCKDRHMLDYWSPQDAHNKGLEQIGLLRAAFHMLRPGGRLVYSTCSLSTEENESVLVGLQKRYPDRVEFLRGADVPGSGLAAEVAAAYPDDLVAAGARVWPHLHATEGAFVACLGKRAETTWDPVEGDAGEQLAGAADAPDPDDLATRIQDRWGFAPSIPAGQELVAAAKYALLRPAGAARLVGHLPWFVRAGMRVAGLHKDHFYLSQQAVALWGHRARRRRLDLEWPQVEALFRAEEVSPAPIAQGGEVICFYEGLPICRGVVARDGAGLVGYVPKALRTSRLGRLRP